MTKIMTDTKPIYDYKNGRWLCRNYNMAKHCASDHPSDYVCVYDRDSDGNMIDIEVVHDPHSQTPMPPKLRGGRIRGTLPSELDDK